MQWADDPVATQTPFVKQCEGVGTDAAQGVQRAQVAAYHDVSLAQFTAGHLAVDNFVGPADSLPRTAVHSLSVKFGGL